MGRVSGAGATIRVLQGRLALSGRPERFAGSVDVAADEVEKRDVSATRVRVRATLNGRADGIGGTLALSSASALYAGQQGSDLAARGRYQVRLGPSPRGMFEGQMVARAIELNRSVAPSLLTLGRGLNGTPLQAPARRFGLAADAALRRFQLFADVRLLFDQGSAEALVRRGQLTSASGARVALTSSGATGLRVDSADPAAFTVDARVTSSGGGLPVADVRVSRTAAGAFAGVAEVEPYTAGGSSISLSPVRFARGSDGRTTVKGTVELTGPFAGGRVERARLPLALVLGRSGELTVNTACVLLSFDEASLSGVVLGATTLRLCPEAGRAVLRRSATGALSAGARVDDIGLSGRIGQTPVRLNSGPASVELTNGRFSVSDLEARVGAGESVTRLDLGSLSGAFRGKGARGRFDGAAGQVGAVPIVWSKGAGRWSLDGGRLALAARLVVDDAATPRRFETLVAPDFQLRFGGSLIEARGTLIDPATRRPVTAVTLSHSFRSASGQADLAVRDLRFDDALQPSGLTRLALGVVANVRGEVSGDARVGWGGTEGVVSTGTFRTTGMDLAAAFGPVAGLSTTVRFTDLLNLVTADDQLLTVDEINPGTPVLDGRVRYALVPGRRIAVRDGRWPFAGGRLTLRPTVLDFADGSSQRFVVDVDGLDAAVLVQDLEFENIAATGLFDGRLPLVFTGGEGRVDGGRLSSRAPGGTLAYVGAVTQEDLGFFPNLAFEALKSLRYDQLDITMEGPLSGSMVTAMRFDGLAQGAGAKRNLLARAIEGLPFVFKIRVTAPFRQLLATARSFNDPSGLVERNLGLLYEEQRRLLGDQSVEGPVRSAKGKRTCAMIKGVKRRTAMLGLATATQIGCVQVQAPDKPIVIELNINIRQEVVYRLDAKARDLIEQETEIF